MYKSYRLNKLARLNELINLNPKFATKSKSKPVISSECGTQSCEHEASAEKKPRIDSTAPCIHSIRNILIPKLELAQKQNNVTLLWNLHDEVTKTKLTNEHPYFKLIKEYEIFGHKKTHSEQQSPNEPEQIDKAKWLSLAKVKSKTIPTRVVLKDFQKGNVYLFTVQIIFTDDSVGKFGNIEKIVFD
ncbi:hypothetical protein BpHYR1_016826 [Brachionus plicatilis]|uniref:Activating transcription factor 7-interacting protein Fn3 domain-containing protein n=1 Tax=Brachionus plicatilis TaxID=10195 RepID=A0A3M7SG88_BRAPC|nr:hypothetical protein BpHYR1_016826 [Brachionus plicatilis]